jgi:hypothetical protein
MRFLLFYAIIVAKARRRSGEQFQLTHNLPPNKKVKTVLSQVRPAPFADEQAISIHLMSASRNLHRSVALPATESDFLEAPNEKRKTREVLFQKTENEEAFVLPEGIIESVWDSADLAFGKEGIMLAIAILSDDGYRRRISGGFPSTTITLLPGCSDLGF